MQRTGGELVLDCLRAAEISTVFGIISVHNIPIFDAIAREGGVRVVPARTEHGAAAMADGFARATGQLAAVLTSTAGGAANASAPLLEAFAASSPVLHITGQVEAAYVDKDKAFLHDVKDQLGMLASVSKAAFRAARTEDIEPTLRTAVGLALSGRPGPVSVEIPIDQQYRSIDVAGPVASIDRPAAVAPDGEAVARAAELLREARRPLIWAGGGVIAAGACGELQTLAERIGAGVLTSASGRGSLPEDHPQTIGFFGLESAVGDLLGESDLLLAVGTRLRGNETRNWQLPLPTPRIQMDVEPSLLGRNYAVDVAIAGDARLTLQALLDALQDGAPPGGSGARDAAASASPNAVRSAAAGTAQSAAPNDVESTAASAARSGAESAGPDAAWLARIADARRAVRQRVRSSLGPYERLLDDLRATLPRNAIVVRDVTVPATTWGGRLLETYGPRTTLYSATYAIGMGFGLAIGAAIGNPDREVVLLAGDGGFVTAVGELATVAQERAHVRVVLFNDGGYGILRSVQDRQFEGRHFAVDLETPDFPRLADAFGVWSAQVRSPVEFGPQLREALAHDGPSLLEVDVRALTSSGSAAT